MTSRSDSPIHALILAGSRGVSDPVAAETGTSCKALVSVHGMPMIERVIATLQAVPAIERIAIALPDGLPLAEEAPRLLALLQEGAVIRLDPAGSPSRSVARSLAALPEEAALLVTTADHPLLTPEMVAQFLDHSRRSGADATAGVAPMALVAAAYPRGRRTRLRFSDGGYSGCNLFFFAGPRGRALPVFWQRMEQHRKRPWRMALAIGPLTVLLFGLNRLSLDAAIARIGRRVGARLAAIRLLEAEAAIDVDTPDDRRLAEEILARRECGLATAAHIEALPAEPQRGERQQGERQP